MLDFYAHCLVVITGGCGFIGSHLATELVKLKARVTIIDDLSTGSLKNIEHIKNDITFINKSICDYQACIDATRNADVIFHLAAFISVPLSLEQPLNCYETNVNGTLNILEAARINGVKRITFSSSAAVYGSNLKTCSEDSTPANPTTPYGYSKLMGELYCQQYAQNYDIHTVILRYFNVYGPGQNPHSPYAGVVSQFLNRMQNNQPITIYGNGLQTRDFVPVSYVVKANLLLAMRADKHGGEIYNIATGNSITLMQLIDKLKVDFPTYSLPLNFLPMRAGDISSSTADCSKYQYILNQHSL